MWFGPQVFSCWTSRRSIHIACLSWVLRCRGNFKRKSVEKHMRGTWTAEYKTVATSCYDFMGYHSSLTNSKKAAEWQERNACRKAQNDKRVCERTERDLKKSAWLFDSKLDLEDTVPWDRARAARERGQSEPPFFDLSCNQGCLQSTRRLTMKVTARDNWEDQHHQP